MVDGVPLSLSCRSDAPVVLGLVHCGTPVQFDAGHGGRRAGHRVMSSQGAVALQMPRPSHRGASADMDPQATEPLKLTAEALEGIIGPGY